MRLFVSTHHRSGTYVISIVDRSGCDVTGQIDVTSSDDSRTSVTVAGAGKTSTCSTGARTVAPRIVSSCSVSRSIEPGYDRGIAPSTLTDLMSALSPELLARAPKALLHDHLDGGVRPATVVELAARVRLPRPADHRRRRPQVWFNRGAKRNDLVLYLETFAHTVGVMQHQDAIERVAAECAEDLAADGVVYAEVRMAPELCTEAGPRPSTR